MSGMTIRPSEKIGVRERESSGPPSRLWAVHSWPRGNHAVPSLQSRYPPELGDIYFHMRERQQGFQLTASIAIILGQAISPDSIPARLSTWALSSVRGFCTSNGVEGRVPPQSSTHWQPRTLGSRAVAEFANWNDREIFYARWKNRGIKRLRSAGLVRDGVRSKQTTGRRVLGQKIHGYPRRGSK